MSLRFTMLASGSAGNAALVETSAFGVLVDAGLGPRVLAARLAAVGATWEDIDAVLLTHTHSDHWNGPTFAQLLRRRIPLYCHAEHVGALTESSTAFQALYASDLVRLYIGGEPLRLSPGLSCRPIAVRHDSGATFGFRFEGSPDIFGETDSLAYVSDLGSWDADLAQSLANVDVLALEFNHDVELEESSGRAPYLIARVLGDEGHLSNRQAAALLEAVLANSEPGRLRHLVQLHLSRHCNRTALAIAAAREALGDHAANLTIHTARQDRPGPRLALGHWYCRADLRPMPRRLRANFVAKPLPIGDPQPNDV